MTRKRTRCPFHTIVLTLMLVCIATTVAAQTPIINPGAPGQPSRILTAEEAIDVAKVSYSQADVKFMQDMIPHHHQALLMSGLVTARTNRNELIEVAERISKSQQDEITFMQQWLVERGQRVPAPSDHAHMHISHQMAGMASEEQMAELEAAKGADFDKLFLSLMIEHHKGALTMVEDLLELAGTAYEPIMFDFTNDITSDQEAEIERMDRMLAGYTPDPRVGLAAGYDNAGQALHNLALLASLPKPAGFINPENPAGLPLSRFETEQDKTETEPDNGDVAIDQDEVEKEKKDDEEKRSPLQSFSNTDMAFAGDVLVAGNYHGFNIYRIGDKGVPTLISSVVCPGGQGDVSIVENLLLMSVEHTGARIDCGLGGVPEAISSERFIGLRIFDISDLAMPRQVGAVQTCRGSHTHSVVSGPDEDGRIIVYNSGTKPVRDEEELAGCFDEKRYGDERTALFRIDIIEIPLNRPLDARIIDSPTVFADPNSGVLAGLWKGGDHGEDTQETNQTNHCHDITVFPELNIAAGACSGNGILFDISDPLQPKRIDDVADPNFAYWHSATFNNDGSKLLFTDEWGGGSRPRCLPSDKFSWGANAIFDIVDGRMQFAGYYKLPAPQTEEENCVAHNGSIIPVPGRDLFVQAWYQGGISIMDFTDSAKPFEIAFFDRGPVDAEDLVSGGFWSAYWYDGHIYGTEIARGLDVLALKPSEYLSENEILAAKHSEGTEVFNPQQQYQFRWRAEPVVARAYIDQLQRDNVLSQGHIDQLNSALARADTGLLAGGINLVLANELVGLARELAQHGRDSNDLTRSRLSSLSSTLEEIAQRLR